MHRRRRIRRRTGIEDSSGDLDKDRGDQDDNRAEEGREGRWRRFRRSDGGTAAMIATLRLRVGPPREASGSIGKDLSDDQGTFGASEVTLHTCLHFFLRLNGGGGAVGLKVGLP